MPAFAWRDSGNPRKSSVSAAVVPAEIRTEHFSNMHLERLPLRQPSRCVVRYICTVFAHSLILLRPLVLLHGRHKRVETEMYRAYASLRDVLSEGDRNEGTLTCLRSCAKHSERWSELDSEYGGSSISSKTGFRFFCRDARKPIIVVSLPLLVPDGSHVGSWSLLGTGFQCKCIFLSCNQKVCSFGYMYELLHFLNFTHGLMCI
jgi:hypothetical protein